MKITELADHDLQELVAAALHETVERGGLMLGAFELIDTEDLESIRTDVGFYLDFSNSVSPE